MSHVPAPGRPAACASRCAGRTQFFWWCASLSQFLGGRIIPSFTRNWLAKRNGGEFPADEVRKTVDGRDVPGGPHGSRQMPVWGVALYYADTKKPREEQQVREIVDRVVEYLRTTQKE